MLSDALLVGAPDIVLLATSRRALRSAGEEVVPLGPLDLDVDDDAGLEVARACGALTLFESRVRASEPRFALTRANLPAATEICRRFDGVPLAIELAASHVPLLGVSGVRDRLREGSLPRTRSNTGIDERHRTLESALAWSHALLSDDERTVFRRLGTFTGGFALDDAIAVCADATLDTERVIDGIDGLIAHSLIVSDTAALHDLAPPRFSMHEMMRIDARARLDGHPESDALRRRHAERFARIAEGEAGPATMRRPDREQALPIADHDNLRAALDWSLTHAPELALRLATAATGFWRLRAHHAEALRRCEAVLADPRVQSEKFAAARARLMLASCGVAFEVHRLELVESRAAGCMDLYRALGDAHGMAHAVLWSGIATYVRRDLDVATTICLDALSRFRTCGDRDGEASACANLGSIATERGLYDDAVGWLREALRLHRALDSQWGIGLAMENLGEVAFARGDFVAAHGEWVSALAAFRAFGHEFRIASMLQHLAAALCHLERLANARECLLESVALCRRGGFEALLADGLVGMAGVAVAAQDHRTAAILLRVASRRRERLGSRIGGIALMSEEAATRAALASLDARQWRDACVDAESLSPAQAVALFESAPAIAALRRH